MTVNTIEHIQQEERIPAIQACLAAGVPYATHKRWKARVLAGLPPVGKPGPCPVGPLDEDTLLEQIRALAHGFKRTHGTGKLYATWRPGISRRDLQVRVKVVRDEENAARAETTRHLEWIRPGSVWATDTTEVAVGGQKYHIQTVRDLASRYTLTPHTSHVPTDEENARMLEDQFRRYGAPLFLKRDNGSNENGPAIARVLAAWGIIPINSPVAYPQYNGAVERAQDEIQDALAADLIPAPCLPAHAAAHLGRVAHDLNHRRRASLRGRCACELFHPNRRHAIVTRGQRKEVAEELMQDAAVILAEVEVPTRRQAQKAWRLVVEDWLLNNGYVVEKTKAVSPSSSPQKGS